MYADIVSQHTRFTYYDTRHLDILILQNCQSNCGLRPGSAWDIVKYMELTP